MKNILLLTAVVGLFAAVAPDIHAQAVSKTIKCYANTSSNCTGLLTIDCRRQQNVALQVKVRGAATPGNFYMSLRGSVDGSTNSNVASWPIVWNFTCASNANAYLENIYTTNIVVAGYPYLQLVSWTNDLVLTTNTITYWTKPNAP